MKWPWIILFFIIIWCMLDLNFGRLRQKKQVKKREYPFRTGEMNLFTTGPKLFSQYFTEIEKAQSSVNIIFYIVKNDQISKKFFSLLEKKAKDGIKVRLLIDWLGSHRVGRKNIKKARAAGVEIALANRPRLPFLFFSLQKRNHRKISVIDGKIGYLGGYNIGKEYIHLDPILTPWRDYHLRVTGEGVSDLQNEFFLDWVHAGKKDVQKDMFDFPTLPIGSIKHTFIPSEGAFLEEQLIQLFTQAKESIYIGTPYFIPTKKLQCSLLSALKRNISIKILVPKKSDHILVKEASYRYLRALMAEGAEVYEYINGFFHAKIIIIDEEICDIGTANFDRRSMLLNHEINCIIYQKEYTKQIVSAFSYDLEHSQRLNEQALQNLHWVTKSKELITRLIENFL